MNGLTFTSAGSKLLLIILLSCGLAFSQEKPILCGTKDRDAPQEVKRLMSQLPEIMARQNARTAAGEMRLCRVAVDIDSDTYLRYERDTAWIIQKVIDNVERASKFFEREANIRMMVTDIRIFKDDGSDPYAAETNVHGMLGVLANRKFSDLNFDKRMLLYTKSVSGGTSGVAFIGGVFNVSPLEHTATLMHELGHNFGSYHSNNCGWPGGPLDYCAGAEGDCYDKSSENNTKGSLMSQCGSNTGGSTLHPMIQAVIKQHSESNFSKIESAPQPVALKGDITAIKGDFYAWPGSVLASSYEFSFATDASFAGESIEATAVNGIYLLKQTLGTDYFVRVRGINSSGTSDWSNTVRIRIDPDQPDVPVLLGPASNSFFPPQDPLTLSFSTVPGATSYRIQVAGLYDFGFAYPTDEIISGNQYSYSPYYGGYKWRVKAIQNGKSGKWSETGYFFANPRLNAMGLHLPVPDNRLNAQRTLPISYVPAYYYSNTRITIADNPGFNNPLFQRNYTPFYEITDVVKDLPANTELFFRVQERNTDVINYPDRDMVDYTVQFTTGSDTGPPALTFLSEKDQSVFGRASKKIAISKGHIWLGVVDAGFVKLDQKALTFQAFNRDNTDGLLGIGLDNPVRADNDFNVHIINPTDGYKIRKVKLANEVPSSEAAVASIPFVGYIQDFNPQHHVFWTQRVIFKEIPGSFLGLRQVSENQVIKDIRFHNNKAWILIVNTDRDSSTEILVMDLDNHDLIYTINFETSPAIESFIDQIEIQSDGQVWLRQSNFSSVIPSSIAHFDGTSWSRHDAGNAPFGPRISSIGVSPSGNVYAMAIGTETQIYKFENGNWEKAGETLPYQNFDGDLWIDNYESFWISNRFGLSRLASKEALPVTLVSFRAVPENKVVALSWEVADQVDMSRYVVEHSTNARKFDPIGETPAIDTAFYNFTHLNPAPGINYYRLKSIENGDDYAYSKVIKVNMVNREDITVYPNPVANQLQVKVRQDLIGLSGGIAIFTTDGKRIYGKKIDKFKALEHIDVSHLASGNYLIQIENKSALSSRIVQVVR